MRGIRTGLLFLSLGIASVATADPVTATSGVIFLSPFGDLGSFNLEGAGFAASGTGTVSPFAIAFNAGQTLDISQTISIRPGPFDQGTITAGGVSHEGFVSGRFQIAATPFVVGNVPGVHTITTTFTLSGLVQLFARPSDSAPLMTEDVTGAGTASLTAQDLGGGHYLARNDLLFTLGPGSVSTTPEPASVLLFATGLWAVWQSKRVFRRRGRIDV